jgi:hypothetical protein
LFKGCPTILKTKNTKQEASLSSNMDMQITKTFEIASTQKKDKKK